MALGTLDGEPGGLEDFIFSCWKEANRTLALKTQESGPWSQARWSQSGAAYAATSVSDPLTDPSRIWQAFSM